MRSFFAASLIIAGLAGQVVGDAAHDPNQPTVKRRKTLGFGPFHPHAVFKSTPYQINTKDFRPLDPDSDPYEVAQRFLVDILGDQLSETSTFSLRKDSYTDDNTGVTHVYVRQIINGIEVVDGDINLNIKDGAVLSFGNSFYSGPTPPFVGETPARLTNPHADHCLELNKESQNIRDVVEGQLASQGEQVIMGFSPHAPDAISLEQLHEWNCVGLAIDNDNAGHFGDPRVPLLHFMAAATPNEHVVRDIAARFHEHVNGISSSFVTSFVGSHEIQVELLYNVPDTVSPVKAKMAYVQVPEGRSTVLQLVWRFEVEMQDNWYETTVSAIPPHNIISVVDWASDSVLPLPEVPKEPATYKVFAWGVNDPTDGNRSIAKENFDAIASPVGWHSLPYANDPDASVRRQANGGLYRNTTTTWGNNVFAHENWQSTYDWIDNYRPDGGKTMTFDFVYDPKVTNRTDAVDEARKYINATVTQLFYITNMFHDLFYRYGFDEVSGNFQQYNFGRGGQENDAIVANAQDGNGFNNADFMTPPDGQQGRCRMYLWSTALPYRDGDLEAGIIIHELSHGLSTRLTGGPANSGCLGWGESGGMGEGWGDFYATVIRSSRNYSDYPMGAWAANKTGGIRNYPYSLNQTINPSTYKTLDQPSYWGVHSIGEVWAEILWIMNQRLIAKHGFTDDLFPPAPMANGTVPDGDFYRPAEYTAAGKEKPRVPKHGNSLSVQLVLNGMKLQPCRPSFFDARDSIIQADQVLTGGENYCELWGAFAERGLGPNATIDGRAPWGGLRTNDFDVPFACKNGTNA